MSAFLRTAVWGNFISSEGPDVVLNNIQRTGTAVVWTEHFFRGMSIRREARKSG